MTPYLIFAIALTIGYFIYYAYNIIKDWHGKKNTDKGTEETFEVGLGDDAPTATPVMETANGFSLGEEASVQQTVDTTETASAAPLAEQDEPQSHGNTLQKIQDGMEEADISSSNPMKAPQLEDWMMHQNPAGIFHNPAPKITQQREQY